MKADAGMSNLKCERAKRKGKPNRIADREGLALLITPEGGKLWRERLRGKRLGLSFSGNHAIARRPM
jgi:hypothetical protein